MLRPLLARLPRRRWPRVAAVMSIALGLVVLGTIVVILPWRWIPPPTSAFMLQARIRGTEIRYEWIPWRSMSPNVPMAAVASEDQKFAQHHGFDVESVRLALEEGGRRPRGASTITQQVAKNLFLWPGRSWLRKGVEAYLTVFLEFLWPKRRILEVYVNLAEYGAGVYGVEAAAREYFQKPASSLTLWESALLAAVLPSPRRMSPGRPSPYVRTRAQWIVRQVRQLGGPAYLEGL